MAHQRWNEQGRDDERASTRDDREERRDRFGDGDEARGTYGRRQFSDDANQGGYAQGQYARERGRHEQSGYGHGGRDGQGGAGQGSSRLVIPAAQAGTARSMNTVAKLAALAED